MGRGPSCGSFILVDKAAEDLMTSYPRRRQVGDRGLRGCRRRPADAGSGPGAGDAGYSARRTRPGPPAGAAARRSTSDRWPRTGLYVPSVRHKHSRKGCGGIFTTSIPAAASIASNASVNCPAGAGPPSPGGCPPSPGSTGTPSRKSSLTVRPPPTCAVPGSITSPMRSRWTAASSARCSPRPGSARHQCMR
jgi:hypothetical protein